MQATIQTPTNKLSNSQHFYQQLNFSQEQNIFTDGQVMIELNPDRTARTGINFYDVEWESFKEKLSVPIVELSDALVISDPNGVLIYLKKGQLPKLSVAASTAMLGKFAGVSIETTDIATSMKFWSLFGYQQTQGAIEKGWVALSNTTGLDISLMKLGACPHLFFTPSLTYFNGGSNLPVIQQIREKGIPITEEITCFSEEGIVDNIIIRDPGGLGFFVFND